MDWVCWSLWQAEVKYRSFRCNVCSARSGTSLLWKSLALCQGRTCYGSINFWVLEQTILYDQQRDTSETIMAKELLELHENYIH